PAVDRPAHRRHSRHAPGRDEAPARALARGPGPRPSRRTRDPMGARAPPPRRGTRLPRRHLAAVGRGDRQTQGVRRNALVDVVTEALTAAASALAAAAPSRRRALARSGEKTLARGRDDGTGIAVQTVVTCARALDGHRFAGTQRIASPTEAHQAVGARQLEPPFGSLVGVDRSARPLLVAARIPQTSAPAPLANLLRTHVDPRVRIRPLDLEYFAGDLDLARGIELGGERMVCPKSRRCRKQAGCGARERCT